MSSLQTFKRLALVVALAASGYAGAEDIDLFEGGAAITGDKPNILIILDNTSNWSRASEWNGADNEATQGAAQIEAIRTVLSGLTENVRIGLMEQSQSGSTSGGYVRFGVRDMSATNRDALGSILAGIKPNVGAPTEKIAQSSYSGAMREAYQYFSGLSIFGPNDTNRDYAGNGAYNTTYTAGNVTGNPLSDSTDTTYTAPLSNTKPCAKNFIIFIGNEWSNATDGDSGLAGLGGSTTAVYTNDDGGNHYGDEWARFLNNSGAVAPCGTCNSKVVTYTINVCYKSCVSNPSLGVSQEALLKSMATVGGGKYFRATSTAEIRAGLQTIINEVQAVDSVFTSASLPVSVNTQGTYLNQIYMGVFRPDGTGAPRWMGNLKQYQFGLTTDATGADVLFLADATGASAVNTQTGFMSPNAQSFWTSGVSPACTSDATKGFWCFDPAGVGQDKDLPDGDIVEKGAAAQKLRALGPAGRTMYTCTPNCSIGVTPSLWHTDNTHLVTALTGTSANITSLGRSGLTVSVAVSADLSLNSPTDTVTISGSDVAAYNTLWTVNKTDATHFTFTVSETPQTPVTTSGMTAASGSNTTQNVTSLTYDSTAGSATLGKAVAALANHGFISGQTITIAGVTGAASDQVLNGSYVIDVPTAHTFTYTPTLTTGAATETPAAINQSGVIGATATCGSTSYTISKLRRDSGSDIVTAVTSTANNSKCKMTPSAVSVTIAGATAGYDTTVSLHGVDASCPNYAALGSNSNQTICYTISYTTTPGAAVNPTSPAAGTIQATGRPTKAITSITRTAGGGVSGNAATATATISGNHGFGAGSSVTIAGAPANADGSASQYNGSFTIASPAFDAGSNTSTFTYPITTGPGTPSVLGTVSKGSAVPASTLINWVRGTDNKDDENANSSFTDVRTSIHGDVLHSRPLVVNYGGATGIYAFYGSNDGTLRAVKGGQAATDGDEAWAFIAPEHYSKLGRLYLNQPLIKFPNTDASITPTPTPRDYFFDGNLGIYQSADRAATHIFASMRRGGRSIYAIDVSTPTAPKFVWKRSNTDTAIDAKFSELGQTWSLPKVAPIRATNGVACSASTPATFRRALIFGAGYDATEEDKTAGTLRSPTMGRGVFVLDAADGSLIKRIDLPNAAVTGVTNATKRYSVPSEVQVIDTDGDGCFDRLYLGDTGANLFRVDIGDDNPDNWKAYKIAALGDIADNGGSDDRKFLYPPDVVFDYVSGQQITYLLAGTGDREQPRATAISDKFFLIKDTIAPGTDPTTVSPVLLSQLTAAGAAVDLTQADVKGWYLDFELGEKAVNAPLTVGGKTFFGTNRPMTAAELAAQSACTPDLGVAHGYAINFTTGTAAYAGGLYATFVGGGLPPSPVAGVVEIGDKKVRFVIGAGATGGGGGDAGLTSARVGISIEGTYFQSYPSSRRTRAFWYFKKDD